MSEGQTVEGKDGVVVVRSGETTSDMASLLSQGDQLLLKHAPFKAAGGSDGSPWRVDGRGLVLYVQGGFPEVCEALAITLARSLNVGRALLEVESATRVLDDLFGGRPDRWTLGGRKLSEDASQAMLIVHDTLNDVRMAREDPDVLARYYADRDERGSQQDPIAHATSARDEALSLVERMGQWMCRVLPGQEAGADGDARAALLQEAFDLRERHES